MTWLSDYGATWRSIGPTPELSALTNGPNGVIGISEPTVDMTPTDYQVWRLDDQHGR
jgi:hypothetical protein